MPVQLLNGATIKFEVNQAGREDVSFDAKQFQPVADAIKGVVQMIATPIQKARPKKATVKFGSNSQYGFSGHFETVISSTEHASGRQNDSFDL